MNPETSTETGLNYSIPPEEAQPNFNTINDAVQMFNTEIQKIQNLPTIQLGIEILAILHSIKRDTESTKTQVETRVTTVETQMTTMQSQMTTMQSQTRAMQSQMTTMQSQMTTIQNFVMAKYVFTSSLLYALVILITSLF